MQRNGQSQAPAQNRSCDTNTGGYHNGDDDDCDDDVFASHEDEGIAIGELEHSSDSSKLRNLKNKYMSKFEEKFLVWIDIST